MTIFSRTPFTSMNSIEDDSVYQSLYSRPISIIIRDRLLESDDAFAAARCSC